MHYLLFIFIFISFVLLHSMQKINDRLQVCYYVYNCLLSKDPYVIFQIVCENNHFFVYKYLNTIKDLWIINCFNVIIQP